MYIVSQPKPLSDGQNQALAKEDVTVYPQGYLRFLRRFGEGTYRGWLNVQLPNAEVLKPFVEYGLWEHDENSPISEQQIGECIVIGTTVDGDFLAVHPQTARLLWLPRHAEHVKAISCRHGSRKTKGCTPWCWMKYIVRCMESAKGRASTMNRGRALGAISFCVCHKDRISLRCPNWPTYAKTNFRRICPLRMPMLVSCSTGSWAAMYD